MSFGIDRFAHVEWGEPLAVTCLAALISLALARVLASRRRRLLGPRVRPGLSPASDAALLLALAATAVALVGPRFGERIVHVAASGIDVVLLVDVSRSMDAADVAPSRLHRARRAGEEILARLAPSDRVALAAFAGRGVLLTPLTPDRSAVIELLGALDSDLVQPPSSQLGAGVRAALEAFETASERPRVLFVLSDGEDPMHRGDLGIPDALSAEVRVLAAAIGTELGATIPDGGTPLRDSHGAVVVSRRRTERLVRLTSASGGEVFQANRFGELDFAAAARAVRRDVGERPGKLVARRVRAVQVLPFAALAFLLLAAEALPLRRLGRGAAAAAAGLAIALLLGAAPHQTPEGGLAELEARVAASPGDPRLLIELGLARLDRGRHEGAERAFLAAALAARDTRLAATAYYDLGVAALEGGDLAGARDAFFDALALDPGDQEARFNLEWTLKALPKDPPPAPGPPRQESSAPELPDPEAPPQAAAEAEPEPAQAPQALDEAQRQRWLGRVQDDPARALRSAVRGGERLPTSRELAW